MLIALAAVRRRLLAGALSALLQPRAGSRGPRERRRGLDRDCCSPTRSARSSARPSAAWMMGWIGPQALFIHNGAIHVAVRASSSCGGCGSARRARRAGLERRERRKFWRRTRRIAARDGYALAATVFTPQDAPRGAVLINSATAVPRKIYRGFATYLARAGLHGSHLRLSRDRRLAAALAARLQGAHARLGGTRCRGRDRPHARGLAEAAARGGRPFVRRSGGRPRAEQRRDLARAARRRAGRLLAAVPFAGEVSRLSRCCA